MIALKFSFDVKNIARSPRSALRKFWQILATAVIRDIHVNQMYVKASFLNGDLSEDIFMDQLEGYQDDSGRVCKLKKSLYGLKQAHRSWHAKIDQFLIELGFSSCISKRAIYRMTGKDFTFILIIYVDGLILVCDSMSQVEEFKARISQEFEMKDLG